VKTPKEALFSTLKVFGIFFGLVLGYPVIIFLLTEGFFYAPWLTTIILFGLVFGVVYAINIHSDP